MDAKVSCQKCGEHIVLEDSYAGLDINCPHCDLITQVLIPADAVVAHPPDPEAEQTSRLSTSVAQTAKIGENGDLLNWIVTLPLWTFALSVLFLIPLIFIPLGFILLELDIMEVGLVLLVISVEFQLVASFSSLICLGSISYRQRPVGWLPALIVLVVQIVFWRILERGFETYLRLRDPAFYMGTFIVGFALLLLWENYTQKKRRSSIKPS